MAKVVIADDSRFMRSVLKNIVENMGHKVVGEANDGMEAINLCNKLNPALVILDITMNGMNGIDALKVIKIRNPESKCIMCSSRGDQLSISEATQAGAEQFIVKPFSSKSVENAILEVLKKEE